MLKPTEVVRQVGKTNNLASTTFTRKNTRENITLKFMQTSRT